MTDGFTILGKIMRLSKIITNLFRKNIDPDIYIVSYPKSGRTWLRVMLCHYLSKKYEFQEDVSLDIMKATTTANLPLTKLVHDQAYPNLGISYLDMTFNHHLYSGKGVVFLGRDIKDTLVSAYHEATKREVVFEGSISEFIRDERFGAKKIARFYQMWLENTSVPKSFLYLCYEDMHKEPAKALKSVLTFMGEREINEDAVQSAIRHGSFDNMRKIELSMTSDSSSLRPGNINDQDSFKTRKGVVGNFIAELSSDDIKYIDDVIGENVPFG